MSTKEAKTKKPKEVWFDGPCPFISCLKAERHFHYVCPKCGAFQYANTRYCDECRANRHKEDAKYMQDVVMQALGVMGVTAT